MTNAEARLIAEELLFREAFYLDHSDWTPWIQMYEVDAEYWLPAWRDEYETTADPNTEVSLIYHDSRRGLEERISRIESRKSVHSELMSMYRRPMPIRSRRANRLSLRSRICPAANSWARWLAMPVLWIPAAGRC